MTPMRAFAWLCAALLLTGCSELLPRSRAETHAEWPSFEAVRAAIEQIEPYKTTKADLKALGIGAPGDPPVPVPSRLAGGPGWVQLPLRLVERRAAPSSTD